MHAENLLFDKNNNPKLIDWQLADRKIAVYDVSYFLVRSLDVKQRRVNEKNILKKYFDLLPDYIQEKFKFQHFWLNYRACVTRSMTTAVMAIGPRFADRPDHIELADIFAQRVISAVKDLKPVEAMEELMKQGFVE